MDIWHHDVGLFIPSDIFLANGWIFVEPSTKLLPLEATPHFHLLFPGIRNTTTMRTCLVGSDTSTNYLKVLHIYYLAT